MRRSRRGLEELSFWTGMLSAPSLSLVEGALDPGRDISGTAGQLTLDAAGRDHRGAADAGAGGVPWRHQRRAADRAGAGGGGLVPAARPRHRPGEPCGAARSRGSRPRGDVRRRRPVAHGGLVHQPVPGAARCGCARSRRGAGRGACARARAQARQGAAAGAAGPRARLWAAALSQRADRVAARRLCDAADRLQLSGALRRGRPRERGRLGRGTGGGDAWAAAAIRRCRWRTRSRSMRSRSMVRRGRS